MRHIFRDIYIHTYYIHTYIHRYVLFVFRGKVSPLNITSNPGSLRGSEGNQLLLHPAGIRMLCVYVCMYVCMYVCVPVCMYALCMYVCIYVV